MTSHDLVVVVPGIMGSTLVHHNSPVWEPSAGAVMRAITTFGRSIKGLRVPDGIGDEHPGDGVTPVALMPDLHVVPGIWTAVHGYTRLLTRLHALHSSGSIGKVVEFPYDWRLSNRYTARRLARAIADELGPWRESHPDRADAKVVFVCHSMGGLVARWYIERCGGAELTRTLITIGTPYRGAARAVDQLVNGVAKTIGPFGVDVSDFARSLPSIHQLLPDYACIDDTRGLHRLDEITVDGLNTAMTSDGLAFHADLAAAESARPASLDATHAIVGIGQPTPTTLRRDNYGLTVLDTIGGDQEYGDATVPMVGALGHRLAPTTNRIRRVTENHGALQNHPAVLDEIESILTSQPIRRRNGATVPVRLNAPELVTAGQPVTAHVDIEPVEHPTPAIEIQLIGEPTPGTVARPVVKRPRIIDNRAEATFEPLAPGAYILRVAGVNAASPITPLTHIVLVWH
ncbi:esterase/lipase family protein [Nocardia salmonicida]|uniref:esterase/lipase family protein n=1 Tax=Nocardia salmonicida TaxID=53431 RepID=UPI0034492141